MSYVSVNRRINHRVLVKLTLERRRSGVTSLASYERCLSPWPSISTNPTSGGCRDCDSVVEGSDADPPPNHHHHPPPLDVGGGGAAEV